METVRGKRVLPFEVSMCPACERKHIFNLAAVIDEQVGGVFMMPMGIETVACALVCPTKGTTIVVDIPVTLMPGQSIVRVR